MKLVQDPRHPTRAQHSVSVAGKEYFLDNGVLDGIPDHLVKNFVGHGFVPEGQYLMYMAEEADKDRARIEQEERDADTRKKIQAEHLENVREEERIRVQTRFAEENRLRDLQHHREVELARANDGTHGVEAAMFPKTENAQMTVDPWGDPVGGSGTGHPAPVRKGGPRSVAMTARA